MALGRISSARRGRRLRIARQIVEDAYLLGEGRRPWLVVGHVVDNDTSGQPLVWVAAVLGELGPAVLEQAEAAYGAWRRRNL